MKSTFLFSLMFCLFLFSGCQNEVAKSGSGNGGSDSSNATSDAITSVTNQVVEASCGECQFDMEGNGCDLAVRIDGKSYYVDGSKMSDHGDAHGDEGMCNAIREAKVTGEIKDGRFVATAFEVFPAEKSNEGKSDEKKNHDHGNHDH